MKNREYSGQHLDVTVLSQQGTQVNRTSICHKDEVCMAINKVNYGGTKTVDMLRLDMKDEMQQPYFLERKEGTK
jgi:hypothetical protein